MDKTFRSYVSQLPRKQRTLCYLLYLPPLTTARVELDQLFLTDKLEALDVVANKLHTRFRPDTSLCEQYNGRIFIAHADVKLSSILAPRNVIWYGSLSDSIERCKRYVTQRIAFLTRSKSLTVQQRMLHTFLMDSDPVVCYFLLCRYAAFSVDYGGPLTVEPPRIYVNKRLFDAAAQRLYERVYVSPSEIIKAYHELATTNMCNGVRFLTPNARNAIPVAKLQEMDEFRITVRRLLHDALQSNSGVELFLDQVNAIPKLRIAEQRTSHVILPLYKECFLGRLNSANV